jgi:hypothetical protein
VVVFNEKFLMILPTLPIFISISETVLVEAPSIDALMWAMQGHTYVDDFFTCKAYQLFLACLLSL